nr:MAG TPA: hypothetical protein [Crassvirales sp.]
MSVYTSSCAKFIFIIYYSLIRKIFYHRVISTSVFFN